MVGEISLLALAMRWMHMLAAIVAVGGSIFIRFVLMPVADKALSDEEHARLREPLMRRWKMFVHLCILLFLVSGFYNFGVAFAAGPPWEYHMLFGIKFLLAIAVFFLAVALTSRKAWSQPMRDKPRRWLALLVLLAVLTVMVGGVLKVLPYNSAEASDPQQSSET